MFRNLNAGNPDAWTYVPDTSQPVVNNPINTNGQVRFTLQATSRHKTSFAYSQSSSNGGGGISATTVARVARTDADPDLSHARPPTGRRQ